MATTQQGEQCQSRYYYVGATIDDRYKLSDFIGVGGMACVYRAKEMGAPHDFAIKFLKDEFHNRDYLVAYFEEEATSMRNLAHPNIVRFYRFVNHANYSYIVMDYVDGFALSDVLKLSDAKNTRMPLDEVMRVIIQVARALDTIHRESFVHRDIKPSNVLIDRQTGKAFLTDLGITSTQGAKIEGAGTIAYMAPEQSKTWTADQRSDIYAYGILLYEMLAGKRPFNVKAGLYGAEAEADMLRKHQEAPVPNVTDLRSDLPRELNKIIAKAMAKNPDDRYQSVIEFAQDTHKALKGKLSADLQDFSTVQHRQIDVPMLPALAPANESQNLLRLIALIGIAAIVLGGLLTFGVFFSDNVALPFINTATATRRPASATPIATFTPTANPIEQQQSEFVFLTGVDALAEPVDTASSQITSLEGDVFNYLRVGMVTDFRVLVQIADTNRATRYGIVFRMQDTQNYEAFIVNAATNAWQIWTVVDGATSIQREGNLTNAPNQLMLAGVGDFFEIRSDEQIITYQSDRYPQGSLAIYVEDSLIELDALEVSLLGQAARDAQTMTPTPSLGLADPLRFIRADIAALIATNIQLDTAIDCPIYIEIYDSLDRHLDNDNMIVRDAARDAIMSGAVIYQRCLIESPNGILDFAEFIQDYSDWELSLNSLQQDLSE